MRTLILIYLFINVCIYANVSEYVSISKIHIQSNDNDTIVFDLEFDEKRRALSSSIRAFGIYYKLNAVELSEFKKTPIINFCAIEKEKSQLSKENLSKIKDCLKDDKKCENIEKKETSIIKKLFIRCGRGNQESIYLIFDNKGKLDIEVK
jgi:hypothetical protein